MKTQACECEHVCHTCDMQDGPPYLSPNGNPGHDYAATFNKDLMVIVATPYGHFEICPDCAKDCLQQFSVVDCKAYEG